jgi:6-phosphogluconolactonase
MNMIRVFNDYESLSQGAAEVFVEHANQAITSNGSFNVVLSGGHTPLRMYEILAAKPFRHKICWESVHVFWGDERCVPSDDPRSNAWMARQTLLNHVPIPASHVHTVHSNLSAGLAAFQYETDLRNFFRGRPPTFDLILLGLSENTHTASLFPHMPALDEREQWVEDVYVAEQGIYRVTLSAPLINQTNQVIFLVSGAEKASALQDVIESMHRAQELPSQLIHSRGAHPVWLVDKAAAHKLVAETVEPA